MVIQEKLIFYRLHHIFKGRNSVINCPIDLIIFPTGPGGSHEDLSLFENCAFLQRFVGVVE